MIVIYAEKFDVAKKIVSAIFDKGSEKKDAYFQGTWNGKECCVTWGYGHLCRLADGKEYDEKYERWSNIELPFIPKPFLIKLNTESKYPVKEQYKAVRNLFNKAELIINATDFDREGELIFYYLYQYMNCTVPYKRVMLVKQTPEGFHQAFANLMNPEEFSAILNSAKARSMADWVVGCNLTIAMTMKAGGEVLNVGRVQTPTLSMIVSRQEAIKNFKPEPYYVVNALFETKETNPEDRRSYKGACEQKRFGTKEEAEKLIARCGSSGVITDVQKQKKKKEVPYLYNLDLLQVAAANKYGYSLDRTLAIAQSLYTKGLLTYPRTDSQFLNEDMAYAMEPIFNHLRTDGYGDLFSSVTGTGYMLNQKSRFFDNNKVESHSAIIPTEISIANASLSEEEQRIYDLVAYSVIRMLFPPAVLEQTEIKTMVDDIVFITKGTAIKEANWMSVHAEQKENLLPQLYKDETVSASVKMENKLTEPPKPYKDATILAAMISAGKEIKNDDLRKFLQKNEISGIGTPATRAGIVAGLIRNGYVKRNKNSVLEATEKGIALIHSIPINEIKSAELTAIWEKKICNLTAPELKDFMEEVGVRTKEWCDMIKSENTDKLNSLSSDILKGAVCPICGRPVRYYKKGVFRCTNTDCNFFVFSEYMGHTITEKEMTDLLNGKETGVVKLKTKDSSFEAKLRLDVDASSKEKPAIIRYAYNVKAVKGALCPICKNPIEKKGNTYKCTKESCSFIIYPFCQYSFTEKDIKDLIKGEDIGPVKMKKKDGTVFSSKLRMDDNYKISFPTSRDVDIKCPKCGNGLTKDRWGNYVCSDSNCKFCIREICGKSFTEKEVDDLIKGKTIGPFELKKKDGSSFTSHLRIEEKDGNYSVTFARAPVVDMSKDKPEIYTTCIRCNSHMDRGPEGWRCSSCGLMIPYKICGKNLTADEVKTLLNQGTTGLLSGFISKNGHKFNMTLNLDRKTGKITYQFPEKNN